jgi:hypothetical protein
MSENTAATAETAVPESTEGAAVTEQKVETTAVGKTKAKSAKTGNLILDIAAEVETLSKTQALNRADKLAEDIETNYFTLGGVLKLIADNSWFDGFESFGLFVYQNYGFQERKARYLMQIYTDLVTKQIPWEKVANLGWTKLKDLAGVLTLENVDDWVAKAEKMTVLELQGALKATQVPTDGTAKATDEFSKISIKLKPDQMALYTAAINKGKAELGTDFDSVVLENICAGYVGGTVAVAPSADIKTMMKALGWQAALEQFVEVYPEIDLTVKEPA